MPQPQPLADPAAEAARIARIEERRLARKARRLATEAVTIHGAFAPRALANEAGEARRKAAIRRKQALAAEADAFDRRAERCARAAEIAETLPVPPDHDEDYPCPYCGSESDDHNEDGCAIAHQGIRLDGNQDADRPDPPRRRRGRRRSAARRTARARGAK